MSQRIREIPYNYTSFSDREIVLRFLGEQMWQILERLRAERRTGRSARMLFEVLGDLWVVTRNPYIQDDLLENRKRFESLTHALNHRLDQIVARANGNRDALRLVDRAREAVKAFEAWFPDSRELQSANPAAAVAGDARRQHRFRRAGTGFARHRCHRLARRTALRGDQSRQRTAGRRGGARLYRPGVDDYSPRGRDGLHRWRGTAAR